MARLGGERDVERDDVGFAKYGLLICHNAAVLFREVLIDDDVVDQNALGLEGLKMLDNQPANSSNADNTDSDIGETSADQAIPVSLPKTAVGVGCLPQQCDHLPDDKLRYGG